MPLLTIRTDKKVLQGQSLSYIPVGSAVFKSTSLENIEYAKANGVWQWDQEAKRIDEGSRIFVKDTGSGYIYDIGKVTSVTFDKAVDPTEVEPWPNNWFPKL
jgi:hypothetical protein